MATLFAILIGLPLGVLLVTGDSKGIRPLPRPLMKCLNIAVNLLRSVPFLILMVDFQMALFFVAMFLVLQQRVGNMIYPRVVGTSIGLPGMWVLVAVAVGGDLMGVGGMLLMIPLASVMYALAREFTEKQLTKRNISADKLRDHPLVLKSGFSTSHEKRKQNKMQKKAQKQQEAKTK